MSVRLEIQRKTGRVAQT
uniref:Uncharacterized protein n=1 Tax=Rhizophora mucronata TaxID=61149 RepID=A0A2P2N6K8_RHIMU